MKTIMIVGFIYQWTNNRTGLKYIGRHEGSPNDGYIGSGTKFIEEYNRQSLPKEYYDHRFQTNIPYVNTSSTRFNELKMMVKCIVEASSILSNDPVSLYFMNRFNGIPCTLNQPNINEIVDSAFRELPAGGTPTLKTLHRIIVNEKTTLSEKNLLIFIATDGQPTDESGNPKIAVKNLEKYISQIMDKYPRLYITFMACVSDEKLLETMDNMGEKFERVGVVDQFGVEYKEMMMSHKHIPDWTFTIGDLIAKAMLVSLRQDVKKKFNDNEKSKNCIIV